MTQDTTFTLARHLELVIEAGTHTVQTTGVDSVRILATDLLGPMPVAAAVQIEHIEKLFRYTDNGRYSEEGGSHPYDLQIVPKPPESLGWIQVYKNTFGHPRLTSHLYTTQNSALLDCPENCTLLCVVEIFEGDGLEPQQP